VVRGQYGSQRRFWTFQLPVLKYMTKLSWFWTWTYISVWVQLVVCSAKLLVINLFFQIQYLCKFVNIFIFVEQHRAKIQISSCVEKPVTTLLGIVEAQDFFIQIITNSLNLNRVGSRLFRIAIDQWSWPGVTSPQSTIFVSFQSFKFCFLLITMAQVIDVYMKAPQISFFILSEN
jgi:hypothetical protein